MDELVVGDDVICQWRPGQRGEFKGTEESCGEILYRVTWPPLRLGEEPETYVYRRKDLKKAPKE